MGTRGRTSGAALSVVSPAGSVVTTVRRPHPPADLTEEQAAEWQAVVERLPADWFQRETHALLAQYCRHVVAGRRIAQLIERLEDAEHFNVEDYDRLLKMQEREGRALSSLATRMRISQHATYDKKRKKPIEGARPWKDDGD